MHGRQWCIIRGMKSVDIESIRHSLAHLLAAAIKQHYPKVKLGVGPAIEDGFYYDIDLGEEHLADIDLKKIEKTMQQMINQNQVFSVVTKTIDEAKKWAKDNDQPYKLELIEDFARTGTTKPDAKPLDPEKDEIPDSMTFYANGDFIDLCRGGHIDSTAQIPKGCFKLTKIAGAYWRGDATRPMMQRVYGVAFEDKAELAAYLARKAEAQARDHRKLGQELDLFITSELVGAGLPLFTPRGTVLRDELQELSTELRRKIGYQKVWIPHMTKKDLYEKSGHWAKFGDELFLVKSQETSDQLVLKPMNCPHHGRIFASRVRSYRDMPQRYQETTTVYRDEKSGELAGLSRVRSITQDDSHVFCRPDQIEGEISRLLNAVKIVYDLMDMKLQVRLSYRDDSDSYLGPLEMWQSAEKQLKDAVIKLGDIDYYEQAGEAAFYGPKIDFMATDALGRKHQLATAQLDFVQPERFQLEYIDESGQAARPVMIHCALLGSLERFLSVYIEHTAGKFPVWIAPEQLRIIKLKDDKEVDKVVQELAELADQAQVRYTIDDANNSVSKKIRAAELYKVPYSVVVGEKEAETGQFIVRVRSDLSSGEPAKAISAKELIEAIKLEHDQRAKLSTIG